MSTMRLDFQKQDATALMGVVTSIAGVLSHLKFDNSVTTAITGTGVIVTAVASYWKSRSAAKSARASEQAAQDSAKQVAEIASKASTDNTAKTVLVQTVTSERAKWRAEMREHVAELVMLLRSSARGEEEVSWRRVDQLATGIRLRLNPAGRGPSPSSLPKHENDRKVHAVLDDLGTATPQGVTLHAGIADRIEASMAPMLKAVWEVSKKEAVDGKLQL